MTDKIINCNYKNIGYSVKICAVQAFKRKLKFLNDLSKKVYVDRFLKIIDLSWIRKFGGFQVENIIKIKYILKKNSHLT